MKCSHGEEYPLTIDTMFTTAMIHLGLKRIDEALELFQRVYEVAKRIWGEDHPQTLIALRELTLMKA